MTYPDDNDRTRAYSQPNPNLGHQTPPPDYLGDHYSEPQYQSGPQPISETGLVGDGAVTRYEQAQERISELSTENQKLKPFRPIAIISGAAAVLFLALTIGLLVNNANETGPATEGSVSTVTRTEQAEQPDAETVTKTERPQAETVTQTQTRTETETSTSTTTVTESASSGVDE